MNFPLLLIVWFSVLSANSFESAENSIVFNQCIGKNNPRAWGPEINWDKVPRKPVPNLKFFNNKELKGKPGLEFSENGLFLNGSKVCNVARGISYTEPLLVHLKTTKKRLKHDKGTLLPPYYNKYYRFCEYAPIFTKSVTREAPETLWVEFESREGDIIETSDSYGNSLYLDLKSISGFKEVKEFRKTFVDDITKDCRNFKVVSAKEKTQRSDLEKDSSFNMFMSQLKKCFDSKSRKCLDNNLSDKKILYNGLLTIEAMYKKNSPEKYHLTDLDWKLLKQCFYSSEVQSDQIENDIYSVSYSDDQGFGVQCTIIKDKKIWKISSVRNNSKYASYKKKIYLKKHSPK